MTELATWPAVGVHMLLGLIQGVSEFLPISSSGHLVVAQSLLGLGEVPVLYDVLLHVATTTAVVIFLRGDLREMWQAWLQWRRRRRAGLPTPARLSALFLLWFVLLATVVTVVLALGLDHLVERLFHLPRAIGPLLGVTGVVLFLTRWAPAGKRDLEVLTWRDALLMGFAQGLAVLPGISRSGTTIAVGLFLGFDRRLAARLSFLLSVPVVLGAAVYKVGQAAALPWRHGWGILAACVIAGLVGYLTLHLVSRVVQRARFHWFAYYCWAMAGLLIMGRVA